MEAKLCSCGKPQSYPILHDYDLTDREHLIKDSSFKAGQQAERSRLAAMAPEEARLTDGEIQKAKLFTSSEVKTIERRAQRTTDPEIYQAFLSQELEIESGRKVSRNQLAKVWPIYQAKLEAEREKVLRQVGEWLEKSKVPRGKDNWYLGGNPLSEEWSEDTAPRYAYITLIKSEFESLKSGKLPQEAKQ